MTQEMEKLQSRFRLKCIQNGECILWNGNKYLNGYGQLTKSTYGTTYAHQWACHSWNGSPLPIEKGMCVKHSCDNRLCVNPAHLSYGTLQENIQEMVERNPHAMGRKPPTEEEIQLLHKLVEEGRPMREIARKVNHDRDWVKRVLRDTTND
jgi:hypothetical protein